jgi:2-keto-3-deoxy-L-rhamnonate aldolase RhmA
VEQLRRLAAAAKHRPLKGEALERLLADGEWPSDKTRAAVEAKCANTLFVPMIESVRAVENLDAICSIPGVDAVFVGPNDLTNTMGIPEQRDNPAFVETIQRIIDVAAKHGVAAGAHFSKLEHARRLIRQGGRFIPFSSDARLIQAGVPTFLAALRGTRIETKDKMI